MVSYLYIIKSYMWRSSQIPKQTILIFEELEPFCLKIGLYEFTNFRLVEGIEGIEVGVI